MAVKVQDLKDQTGASGPRPVLRCAACGGEYSAHAGDYWAADPDYEFECCGEPCALVTIETVYKEVS